MKDNEHVAAVLFMSMYRRSANVDPLRELRKCTTFDAVNPSANERVQNAFINSANIPWPVKEWQRTLIQIQAQAPRLSPDHVLC